MALFRGAKLAFNLARTNPATLIVPVRNREYLRYLFHTKNQSFSLRLLGFEVFYFEAVFT